MALSKLEIARHIAQAEEAFSKKRYKDCISILEGIVQENPDYAPAYIKLGYIWMRTDTPQRALPFLEKAMEISAHDFSVWLALGRYYRSVSHFQEAANAFEKALSYSNNHTGISYELYQIYLKLQRFDPAISVMGHIVEIEAHNITYLWEYAKLLASVGKKREALKVYDRLVGLKRSDIPIEAISEWLSLAQKHGDPDLDIREKAAQLSRANPKHPMLKFLYGQSCVAKQEREKALELFDETYRLAPENTLMLEKLSSAYAAIGMSQQSQMYLQRILEKDPLHFDAVISLGADHTYEYGDTFFKKLNLFEAQIEDLPLKKKVKLNYALGKAYEDAGDLKSAFERYRRGGSLRSGGREMNEYASLQKHKSLIKHHITKAFFQKHDKEGYPSKKPVFVLGMPRSGTSLIEQVLSCVEGIYGAGELAYSMDVLNHINVNGFEANFGVRRPVFLETQDPDYAARGEKYLEMVEALSPPDTQRIIDKMPANFRVAGLLHLILPQARIIHSRRHPVEICLSAYRLNFAEGHYWSDTLAMMGKYYRQYHELMLYWKSILPEGVILDVRYEDMVSDLEGESKRLMRYIGMPWDAACLDFHQSKRAVRTASLTQVRQPIYQSSTNRWRKYEPYLKPLLDEIGDLVEAYEAEL